MVLVRHGQTAWNLEHRFVGRTDVPLDATGQQQAADLASAVRGHFDAVYTSSLSRAGQTAAALAPPEPRLLPGIEELDQGALEGLSGPDAMARWPDFFAGWARDPEVAEVPGGERLGEGRDRALDALGSLTERHGARSVIGVVGHQLIWASALCTIGGDRLREWRSYRLPNTGISVIAWDGCGWRLHRHNWSPQNAGSGRADV